MTVPNGEDTSCSQSCGALLFSACLRPHGNPRMALAEGVAISEYQPMTVQKRVRERTLGIPAGVRGSGCRENPRQQMHARVCCHPQARGTLAPSCEWWHRATQDQSGRAPSGRAPSFIKSTPHHEAGQALEPEGSFPASQRTHFFNCETQVIRPHSREDPKTKSGLWRAKTRVGYNV